MWTRVPHTHTHTQRLCSMHKIRHPSTFRALDIFFLSFLCGDGVNSRQRNERAMRGQQMRHSISDKSDWLRRQYPTESKIKFFKYLRHCCVARNIFQVSHAFAAVCVCVVCLSVCVFAFALSTTKFRGCRKSSLVFARKFVFVHLTRMNENMMRCDVRTKGCHRISPISINRCLLTPPSSATSLDGFGSFVCTNDESSSNSTSSLWRIYLTSCIKHHQAATQ